MLPSSGLNPKRMTSHSSRRYDERSGSHYPSPISIAAAKPHGLIGRLQSNEFVIAITSASLVGSCTFLATGSPFSALATLSIPGLLYPHMLSDLHLGFAKACRRCGWNANAILGICFGIAIAAAFLLGSTEAAHAAFYKNVEDWLGQGVLKDQKTLVSLVVNVLRAIFVIYVGIAIVSVVQKMQQGDDWQTAARIPLVVVVCASMGDMLAGMIIGSGSSSGTATEG